MSAADGVVRTDSLGPAPPTGERRLRVGATSAVSPELALIDPDLARDLRACLTEPTARTPAPLVKPVRAQAVLVKAVGQKPPRPASERGRRFRKPRVFGFLALGVLLAVFVRSESRPSALDGIARAVAGPNPQPRMPEQLVPAGAAADVKPTGQTFVWAAEPGAAAYEFQLFRGDARIYRARVIAPRLVLADRWRQGARSFGLTPASYRWYVWPISARTGSQAAVAKVQATLVVARPNR